MTQYELKQYFEYDKNTGIFTRLDRKGSCGSIDHYGYLVLKIKGKQYKSHRMAWLYEFGFNPKGVIDHINGDKLDNRIVNLRDVLQRENCHNKNIPINKDTEVKGVYVDKTKGLLKKFAFKFDGTTYRFKELAEAIETRLELLKGAGYGDRHI
jgi:hypothetical protein